MRAWNTISTVVLDSCNAKFTPTGIVERDIASELYGALQRELATDTRKPVEVIYLQSFPSSGASTLLQYMTFELRTKYPCAVVHSYSSAIASMVKGINEDCSRPMLLAIDHGFDNFEQLISDLQNAGANVVILCIERIFKPPQHSVRNRFKRVLQATLSIIRKQYKKGSTTEFDAFLEYFALHCAPGAKGKEIAQNLTTNQQHSLTEVLLAYNQGKSTYVQKFVQDRCVGRVITS